MESHGRKMRGDNCADSRPLARELDRAGLEKALLPQCEKGRRAAARMALDLATALYGRAALVREDILREAGLGVRRTPVVDAALRLDTLLDHVRTVRSETDGCARLVLAVKRVAVRGTADSSPLPPGRALIETVAIPRRQFISVCLSSQAGCPLGCAFCATGRIGFRADLTAGEIVEQHAWATRAAGRRVTDVVFMGMGEPFLNYDAVLAAAYRLMAAEGAQISGRRIMISTAGIVPRIRQYAREGHPFQLLFSLVSAVPETRSRLMPVAARYPIDDLRDAIAVYQRSKTWNRHVTLEYIAIPGVNMDSRDVEALRAFVSGLPCILNVIPYNVTAAGYRPPTWAEVKTFTTALRSLKVPVKIRYSSGKHVAAGCGQLSADLAPAAGSGGHMDAPPGIFSDLPKGL